MLAALRSRLQRAGGVVRTTWRSGLDTLVATGGAIWLTRMHVTSGHPGGFVVLFAVVVAGALLVRWTLVVARCWRATASPEQH